ncbi:MAG: 4Fe-4S binding protein [Desulfobacterales bacterium]|nr:4Fe-4S binding protein [Desulfobacterales bacterium]
MFDFIKKFISPFLASGTHLLPPGASHDFFSRCIRCGQCVAACQYHSILFESPNAILKTGTPYIDPSISPCYLTMACVKVCPTGALQNIDKKSVRMAHVSIDKDRCVAYKKVICRFCFNNCPLKGEAIIIDRIEPIIIQEKCTGCGICHYVCPVKPNAVIIKPLF